MKESQRKKRQNRQPVPVDVLEERLTEAVRAAAAAHGVLAFESEFAGYFNQLGFRVNVAPGTSPEALVALANALLDTIAKATDGVDLPFTWILGIYESDALVHVLKPGDRPLTA